MATPVASGPMNPDTPKPMAPMPRLVVRSARALAVAKMRCWQR